MTIPTPSDDEKCQTCGKDFGWHRDNAPKHPFNNGQDGSTAFLKRRGGRDDGLATQRPQHGSQMLQMAGDPVLRIALINRGILTPADLVVAEEQLRAALMEVQNAQPPESSRGR